MKLWNRVVIGDGERGLLSRNRRFVRVLAPGVYRLVDAFGRVEVRTLDLQRAEFDGKEADALIERLGAGLTDTFVLADIGVGEVGLVSKNGKLEDVLAPGTRKLYGRSTIAVDVERVAMASDMEVPAAVAKRLRQLGTLNRYALVVDVPMNRHIFALFPTLNRADVTFYIGGDFLPRIQVNFRGRLGDRWR